MSIDINTAFADKIKSGMFSPVARYLTATAHAEDR